MSVEMNDEYHDGCEIRYLGDLQRLQLEPDDVVVITCPARLHVEQMEMIRNYVEQRLVGHKVLVLDDAFRIGVMGKQGGINGAN